MGSLTLSSAAVLSFKVKNTNFQRMAIMMIITIIVLNGILDSVAYRQVRKSDESGEEVYRAYQVINQVDALSIGILQSHRVSAEALNNLAKLCDDEDQRPDLNEFTLESAKSNARPEVQLAVLARMKERQADRLKKQLDADRANSKLSLNESIFGSVVDVAFVIFLFAIFWWDRRRRLVTEARLRETAIRLNTAHDALLAADISKTNLMKMTVHDLKNPLGTIQGFAELLQNPANNKESVIELSEIIHRISDETLVLVNSLLKPASLTTGQMQLDRAYLNLFEILQSAVEDLHPLAQAKAQRLFISGAVDAQVWGDHMRLSDAFKNIIGNAIKFSPLGGEIRVRATLDSGNKIFRIEVEDDGPGMSNEDKVNAFQPGRSLTAKPTAGEVSTGMGLYSARSVIEAHHGRILIDDPEQGGTRFIIEVPILTGLSNSPENSLLS